MLKAQATRCFTLAIILHLLGIDQVREKDENGFGWSYSGTICTISYAGVRMLSICRLASGRILSIIKGQWPVSTTLISPGYVELFASTVLRILKEHIIKRHRDSPL